MIPAGRPLLHLVGADIDGLDELPLKTPLRAVALEAALRSADSGDRAAAGTAAERAVAGVPAS